MTRQATSGSFKKGDPRINRKGRPKKGESVADRFEDMLNEILDPETGYTVFDSMMDAQKKKALQGDLAAFEYIVARAHGKMVEKVESTNKNVNRNYNLENVPLDERKRLREILRSGRTTRPDRPPN